MILDRITAIRVIPPRVTLVPIRSVMPDAVAVYRLGSHERQISVSATGATLDVSYEELEVDLYSPRDVIAYAQRVRY